MSVSPQQVASDAGADADARRPARHKLGVLSVAFLIVAASAPLTVIAGGVDVGVLGHPCARHPARLRGPRGRPRDLRRRLCRHEPLHHERRRLLRLCLAGHRPADRRRRLDRRAHRVQRHAGRDLRHVRLPDVDVRAREDRRRTSRGGCSSSAASPSSPGWASTASISPPRCSACSSPSSSSS